MARICVFTADGGGNLAVMLAVVAQLVRRDHEVDVVVAPLEAAVPTPPTVSSRVAAAGARPLEVDPDLWRDIPPVDPRSFEPDLPSFAVAQTLAWVAPTFPASARAARDVLQRGAHDALLVDFTQGPLLAAEALGLPSIRLIPQRALLRAPGHPVPGRGTLLADMDAGAEAVAAERQDALLDRHVLPSLNDARALLGLRPHEHVPDVDGYADLTLVATSPAFDLVPDPPPPTTRWVGSFRDLGVGAGAWHPPWANDDPRPLVVMSPTTTYLARAQVPFVRTAIEALGVLPVRGLVTVGPHLDPARLPVGDGVVVVGSVAHASVLPGAALMITHAGHGTLLTALRHGVPVVCAPGFADQHDNAARVVDLGLGVRVPQPPAVEVLVDAVRTLLADESYHARVAAFAQVLEPEDGAAAAADAIEAFIEGSCAAPQHP